MTNHITKPMSRLELEQLDIEEPLADSAMLAKQWSNELCRDCSSYHGAWQVLRLLGVLNSMRSDDDFLITQLDIAIAQGAERIMVSGAADYALQARISAVARRHGASPQITVIDLCETPLELNRWYARRLGMDTHVIQDNILNYRKPGYFDLVCTHSFLPFFNPEQRRSLVKVWWDCLAPGGAVLTAQRTRPNVTDLRHEFSAAQTRAIGERAHKLAAENYDLYGLNPDMVRDLAINYARGRSTYVLRDQHQLRQLFTDQGFELEQFAPPGEEQLEQDVPSTPTESGHQRMRILARKPLI